ncbi:MAG: bifunctional glutamate N-acetyltransferase/amino-acid acetyltransferase ArgJ [Spirochaetes bacterium]|nr:bifunctional glutamate N-acetyltransferase/amino-acid acetyltransferase ArgJ [Spirochaetota bacterium]
MFKLIKQNKVKQVKYGICAPTGFTANAVNVGLRKKKLDLGILYSEKPCIWAGTFTKNLAIAAPVKFTLSNQNNTVQAIVVNSGIANACTGKKGFNMTLKTAKITANLFNIHYKNTLIFSTGVIGRVPDIKKVTDGLKKIVPVLKKEGHTNISNAILTTDTVKKEIAVECVIKGKKVKIGAMAKGSGMIGPDMATLLVFVTTDISIEKKILTGMFKDVVDHTLNRITIDGDMSTNDSAVILANGMAENEVLTSQDTKELKIFQEHLFYVMDTLARLLVEDGEGATKFITIKVMNAKTEDDAKKIGFKIANSPLVKTAFFGSDANWGRVLASAGASGAIFDPDKVEIRFGRYLLYKNGNPVRFSEKKLKKYLDGSMLEVMIKINTGRESFSVYTSDLTINYIKINAHYRS